MGQETVAERMRRFGCSLLLFAVVGWVIFAVARVAWSSIWVWASPKPFATINKHFKIISQYQTLAACEKSATSAVRLFGSDSANIMGCINLAVNPKRLVFVPPVVPSDWHLTFTHPRSAPDNPHTEIVGHYLTLRDCLLAAIPLMPSDKKTMQEAGFDCEYGPAQEPKP